MDSRQIDYYQRHHGQSGQVYYCPACQANHPGDWQCNNFRPIQQNPHLDTAALANAWTGGATLKDLLDELKSVRQDLEFIRREIQSIGLDVETLRMRQ